MGWQDGEWWQANITQGFKWTPKNTTAHSGVDFAMPTGTPLMSPTIGTIRDAQYEPWGYQVDEVTNIPGYGTVTESYLHMSSLAVHRGDVVYPGKELGKSGSPPDPKYGNGPHLHFEMTTGANSPYIDYSPHNPTDSQHPLDPMPFVNAVRAAGGAGAGGFGGIANTLDPSSWVAAVMDGITHPFRNLGIDSLSDFFWRVGLILIGTLLVIYALFKLFEPAAKTAVNVGLAAAKVAA